MAQKDIWHENMFHSLDCKCFYGLFTPLMTPKVKKRTNKALSKQSKQFLLLSYFWFKGLSFKTQFKIAF